MVHTAGEQANYYLQRCQARRDGYNSSQGKKAPSKGKMTRTQCTQHFTNIKRICKSYDCSPYSKMDCKAQCIREVKLLPGNWKVLTTDKWVLETVQEPLCKPISTGKLSKPTYVLQRAKPLDTGEGECPTREGGSGQCTQPSTIVKFFCLVPEREVRWDQ